LTILKLSYCYSAVSDAGARRRDLSRRLQPITNMSRHNRRRTRGGHKHHAHSISSNSSDSSTASFSSSPPPLAPSWSFEPWSCDNTQSSLQPVIWSANYANQSAKLSARHWHNRYMDWQARERRQREEQARLEAEKQRIFGCLDACQSRQSGIKDDEVDDEMLEEKMLEYFGGLDFLMDG